jgi:hypothetical protein
MLSQYKNIDKILSSTKATQGQRFSDKEIELLSSPALKYVWKNNILASDSRDNGIEFHVYSGDTWITGNHRIDLQPKNQITYTDPENNVDYRLPAKPWQINLFNEFNNLNIQKGEYRIAVNFFTNLIGSYESQKLKIDEISPDRTELRLRAIDPDDSEFLEQITNYIQSVGNAVTRLTSTESYRTLLVNFSRNQTALFTNSVVIGEYVYVKLYEPLADDIEKDFKCWIVEEQRPTYIDRVTLETFGLGITEPTRKLAGPNWDASDGASTSTDTGLKNWNDILGSSVTTSQQLVDSVFSGSLSGIDLNIDYSDFNNFVFYSSATERVKNFKYKIGLIEYYNSQLNTLGSISGSTAITNIQEFTNLKNSLIGGFDEFEKYLYFESSSTPFTYDLPLADPNVSYITGSYIDPWPKTTTSRPHTLYSSTSSIAQEWYSTLLDNADIYDRANYNSLINGVPLYLRTNPDNEGLETFIHMLGQHYDIIYTYIRNVSKIYSRDEHPKYGVPNELLYSVAKQFGWSLTDGNQYKDLWEYVLGTNEAGIPITGSNTVGDASLPGKDMTYHIWRRIVNNLPGLLKSKGTKRSVKALLSCYGIPQSMISINEYGGPRIERPPVYEKLNFDYALDLIQNAAGTVTVDYDQPINSVELRFRTDNVLTNPALPSTMNLFSVDSNDVTLDFTRGTLGTIQINGTNSADIEMFDGGWLNVLLRSGGNSSLEVVAKKSKYGKIVAAVSASAEASFASTGTVTLGGTGNGARLKGQLQELRLWSSSLQDSPFNNHTKAPAAYDGNVDAYDELVFRLPLTEKTNHTTAVTMSGVEPNLSGISASFASWTNAEPYDSIEETYYYDGISLAAGTFDDNKIRLEDNELVGTLDVKSRAERSQFDKAPLDSNRLGVYFSPQTMIDEDIIAQLGFTELDSYIGDPGQQYERSYPDLIEAAQSYWKKYETKNDLNAYIKIFTLFDLSFFKQLDQLLPARADKITGLLIQPNILERNKDSFLPRVNKQNAGYNTDINVQETTVVTGNYPVYLGGIEGAVATITAQDDDQWQAYLTKSSDERYAGTTYSYQYAVLSGSQYITGSTPTWMSQAVFLPVTGATLSETRESLSYVEYRKSLYTETAVLTSTSSVADSGSDVVFEGVAHTGTNSTNFTFSSSSIHIIDTWYHDYSAPETGSGAYQLTPGSDGYPVIFNSSSVHEESTVDAPGSGYLFEITLPATAGEVSSETIDIYELINSGSGHPTASGGSTLWGDLYEELKHWETLQVDEIDGYPGPSWLPLRLLPYGTNININSFTASLYIGTASIGPPFAFSTGSIPVWIGQALPEDGTYNSTPIDMLLTGSLTTGSLLEALERSGSYSGSDAVVAHWKFEFNTIDPAVYFNSDTFNLVTLNDSAASPLNGHINFAATASLNYQTTASTSATSFYSSNTAVLHGGSFPAFDVATISIDGTPDGAYPIAVETRVDNTTLQLENSTFAISQSYQLDYEVSSSLTGDATLTFGYTDSINVSGSFSTTTASYVDTTTFQIEASLIDSNATDVQIFARINDSPGEEPRGIFAFEGAPIGSANISWSLDTETYRITLLDGVTLNAVSMSAGNPETLSFPSTIETQYIGSTGVTASAEITDQIVNSGFVTLAGAAIPAEIIGTYIIVSKESSTRFTINRTLSSSGSIESRNWQIAYIGTGSYSTGTISVVSSSAAQYPYAEWYFHSYDSMFDTRLSDLEYATPQEEANALQVDLIASASVLQLSLSSSISASIAATYSSSFNEYTGIQIEWEKWFITGSEIIDPGNFALPAPQSANDHIITIDGNAVTAYRTGSASWQRVGYGDDPTLTPGLSASYGLETGADGVIIGDLQAFVDEGDIIEFGIQPRIITNVYVANALVAKARVKNINIFFSYTSSYIYGDTPIGYIVVSGSDILTTDVNGNPVRGIDINGPAQIQDFIGTGAENALYNGSKMTSRGFNIESPDTIDGGPVVETRTANPNQLIYQSLGENGSFTISGQ